MENLCKCDNCGFETPVWMTIDVWCIIDGKQYCLSCQKKLKIGWYCPKILKNV